MAREDCDGCEAVSRHGPVEEVGTFRVAADVEPDEEASTDTDGGGGKPNALEPTLVYVVDQSS